MDSTDSTGQTRKSRLRHVWVFLNDTTVFKGHTQVMPARLPMATQFVYTQRFTLTCMYIGWPCPSDFLSPVFDCIDESNLTCGPATLALCSHPQSLLLE